MTFRPLILVALFAPALAASAGTTATVSRAIMVDTNGVIVSPSAFSGTAFGVVAPVTVTGVVSGATGALASVYFPLTSGQSASGMAWAASTTAGTAYALADLAASTAALARTTGHLAYAWAVTASNLAASAAAANSATGTALREITGDITFRGWASVLSTNAARVRVSRDNGTVFALAMDGSNGAGFYYNAAEMYRLSDGAGFIYEETDWTPTGEYCEPWPLVPGVASTIIGSESRTIELDGGTNIYAAAAGYQLGTLSCSNTLTLADLSGAVGALAYSNNITVAEVSGLGSLAKSNSVLLANIANAGGLAASNTIRLADIANAGSLAASNSILLSNVADAGGIAASNASAYVKSTGGNATNLSTVGHVGVGRVAAYRLDINGGATSNQIHFTSSDADSGGYLVSAGAANAYFSAGVAYDSTWRAKSTSGGVIGIGANAGAVNTYSVTGTTAGSAATIIETARFHALGIILNGPITNNATIYTTNVIWTTERWIDSPMNFSWTNAGGTAPSLVAMPAPFDGIQTLTFADNNQIDFVCQLNHSVAPSNGTRYVEPHAHVLPMLAPPTDANRTQLRIIYAGAAIGGQLYGPVTNQVEFTVSTNTHTMVEFSHLLNSTHYAGLSGQYWGTIKRIAAANSNYAGTISISADFHYPVDRLGSSQDASP